MTANVGFPQRYPGSAKSVSQLSYYLKDSCLLTIMVTAGMSTAICEFTATLLRVVCYWERRRPVGCPEFYKLSLHNVWPSLAAVARWWVWLVSRATILACLGVQSTTFYKESWLQQPTKPVFYSIWGNPAHLRETPSCQQSAVLLWAKPLAALALSLSSDILLD